MYWSRNYNYVNSIRHTTYTESELYNYNPYQWSSALYILALYLIFGVRAIIASSHIIWPLHYYLHNIEPEFAFSGSMANNSWQLNSLEVCHSHKPGAQVNWAKSRNMSGLWDTNTSLWQKELKIGKWGIWIFKFKFNDKSVFLILEITTKWKGTASQRLQRNEKVLKVGDYNELNCNCSHEPKTGMVVMFIINIWTYRSHDQKH